MGDKMVQTFTSCRVHFFLSVLESIYLYLMRTKHVVSQWPLTKKEQLNAEGLIFVSFCPGSFGTVLSPRIPMKKKEILTVNLGNNFFQDFFTSDVHPQGQREFTDTLLLGRRQFNLMQLSSGYILSRFFVLLICCTLQFIVFSPPFYSTRIFDTFSTLLCKCSTRIMQLWEA